MRHEVKKKNLGWHWANMKWLIWNIYSNPHKDVMGADVHRPISEIWYPQIAHTKWKKQRAVKADHFTAL